MRDLHCHILPGVDDGAPDLEASLAMLEAAKGAGITSIVCTPHVRDPYFDYEAMRQAFELLCAHAGGFPLAMGCKLQASADFVAGGRMGRERKPAKKLFEENLYSYIASDAHRVEHYDCFAEARKTYRCRGAHARV